jgi:hypothetical protein
MRVIPETRRAHYKVFDDILERKLLNKLIILRNEGVISTYNDHINNTKKYCVFDALYLMKICIKTINRFQAI